MKDLNLAGSVGLNGENLSEDVCKIQKALNTISDRIGLESLLSEDGVIQDNIATSPTCLAIGAFQRTILGFKTPDNKIDVNGKSHKALDAIANSTSHQRSSLFLPLIEPEIGISDGDFEDAARSLGCELAAILAVSEVESAGSGFFASGLPAILFEAHIFSRHSQHRYDESHPDISSKRWDRSLYVGGEKEFERLKKAIELDRQAALMSASYGRYQIMGFNHKLSGYEDVEAFVRDMFFSESNHLKAFVEFIKSNPKLHDAIKALDWATFARYYNGPAYAENRYDEKLLAAYEKFCG
ncbi:N-acetylmuramidase family protein [Vibrio sp. JPW-9-11-11]|uniref:N-acetylmuramidase family protein n=1 Tax=Vibrio sp. JPW-9-11-11 TaxID=1416532 RepID=UPI0015942929|nr:N-acetylmuramidase family protein [Vibrio sp. JPW-9-11-11]NVD06504.1 N-acetylmuramidase family protein [Vibrio sp. JPW-9-11-11]